MIPETFQTQPLLSGEQLSFDEISRIALALPDRPGGQLSVYYAPARHSPAVETVLLVPGFLQPAYCWRKQIGPLTEAGWNVLTWNPSWSLQGWGGWTESLGCWTAGLATVLAASPFSAHLPMVLVGWSLGGVLIGELLRQSPPRPTIAGLVFVGTPLFLEYLTEFTKTDAPAPFDLSEPLTAQWLVRFTTGLTMHPLAFGEFERHLGGSCLALARLLESVDEQRLSLASLVRPAVQARASIPWHHFRLPTLIIHGEYDRLVPPMLAHQIARQLEDAGATVTLSLYPTGHAPFIEEPARFHTELVTFLQERCLSSVLAHSS
jgi:non-heme chloroperoxidase